MSDYIPHEYFFSQLGQKRDIQDGGDGHIEVSDHYEYKDFCCICKGSFINHEGHPPGQLV